MTWLVVHLVAVAVLTGVGWVVQLVVYPAFRLVGANGWARYHAAHTRAITRAVGLPWLAQGVSTAALLLVPPPGGLLPVGVLAALAVITVVATVVTAVPAHGRLAAEREPADVTLLLRANLVRTLAWTAATVLAAALLI
ncbi:MAG TPA: hypothetical protein VF065_11670 [Ilumatobacter sp.]